MSNLLIRAVVYSVYSTVVWGAAIFFVLARFPETVAIRELGVVACACFVGALSVFASSAFCRRAGLIGLPEYGVSIIGRTGVPTLAVLACSTVLPSQTTRVVALTTLGVYALTAPALLLLTTASSAEFQRLYDAANTKNDALKDD